MTVISGRRCAALLQKSDPLGSLARTFLESSEWNSTMCFLTWKHSATPRGRLLFLLRPSMPDTDEIESGWLATPTATANQLCPSMQKHPGCRALWPTPVGSVAQIGEGTETWLARRERVKETAQNGNGMGMPLTIAVQMWPTPAARDWKDGLNPAPHGMHSDSLPVLVNKTDGGSLNPTWVEWLMGFPLGWTALEPSEMPSSRKSRKSSAGPS
jgi:hypothetical protein